MPQIYNPQTALMSPNGDIIDPSVSNDFTARVNGSLCKGYLLRIYSMDNTLVYTNTSHTIADQDITKYNDEEVTCVIPANTLDVGSEYKWQLSMGSVALSCAFASKVFTKANHNLNTGDIVYTSVAGDVFAENTVYYVGKIDKDTFSLYAFLEGARNASAPLGEDLSSQTITVYPVGVSEQCVFKAYSAPTIELEADTITTYTHEFVPTFSQSEGAVVNSFEVEYYSDYNSDVYSTGTIYSSNVRYTIDGLLTGYVYYIKFTATDNIGQKCTTGYVPFPVSYSTSSMGVVPDVVNNSVNSSVDISWGGIVQLVGELSDAEGVGYDYVHDYKSDGNTALKLYASESLMYEGVNCLEGGSLPMFNWEPLGSNWSGTVFRMDNSSTGEYYALKYDDGVFTKDVNGVETPILNMTIEEGSSFYIGIVDDEIVLVPNNKGGLLAILNYGAINGGDR